MSDSITACIIFKDASKTLPKCLDSLEFQVDEIIGMNNDSKDFSADLFAERKHGVYFNDLKQDVNLLRHELAEMASSEIIIHQDADDYRLKDTVQQHVAEIFQLDLLITPVVVEDTAITILEEDVISDIALGNIQTCALYWRKSAFLSLVPVSKYAWEFHVVYQAYINNFRIGYSQSPSAVYTGDGRITKKYKKEQQESRLKLLEHIAETRDLNSSQYNFVHQAIKNYRNG